MILILWFDVMVHGFVAACLLLVMIGGGGR